MPCGAIIFVTTILWGDDSGYAEPIDTVQEYQDYGLS
jgi:hypothetical protein